MSETIRAVPVDWDALEDAFENNAAEVHSYLHTITGEVVRVVDGIADPAMHARIAKSPEYLRIEAVPSREQYRWMETFIDTVHDDELADLLTDAIDGKGAFRRFKDALADYQEDREQWFEFRTAKLRECMVSWLRARDIQPVPRVAKDAAEEVVQTMSNQTDFSELSEERQHLLTLVMNLREHQLEIAAALIEFLQVRATRKKDDTLGSDEKANS